MTSPASKTDPIYVEVRSRVERLLWREGKQGLDSKYMLLGRYHLNMFTGDGDPNIVSVSIAGPPPTRSATFILNDNHGEFNKGLCEELLLILRKRMVLDDLADI
jgi:hypothetical protein